VADSKFFGSATDAMEKATGEEVNANQEMPPV